jgi:hypothetical protein
MDAQCMWALPTNEQRRNVETKAEERTKALTCHCVCPPKLTPEQGADLCQDDSAYVLSDNLSFHQSPLSMAFINVWGTQQCIWNDSFSRWYWSLDLGLHAF